MSIKIEIEPERLITKETDGRGRVTLGSEYADKQVTIIVSNVEDAGADDVDAE